MIQVGNKIIAVDVFKKEFICDLNSCKGACCVEGDSGAPLIQKEKEILEAVYEKIKPYMRAEGILAVKKQGIAVYDEDGDLTTPLVNNKECAFVFYESGVAKCAIEKAYINNKTDFKKPMSCHLFPIRIQEYRDFDAVNYEDIKICKSACVFGKKMKVPVYVFLKEPLIRKYGEEWYAELLEAASLINE